MEIKRHHIDQDMLLSVRKIDNIADKIN